MEVLFWWTSVASNTGKKIEIQTQKNTEKTMITHSHQLAHLSITNQLLYKHSTLWKVHSSTLLN